MNESHDGNNTPKPVPLSERPGFHRIETTADVMALFGGRTSQQIFDVISGGIREAEAHQQQANEEDAFNDGETQ